MTDNDKLTLTGLMENQLLDRVIDEIIHDISLDIVNTGCDEGVRSEYLYLLTKALKEVKGKLQECVNDIDIQGE